MSKKQSHAKIKRTLEALDKRYKEPVVRKMNEFDTSIKTFSSGRPDLDAILGGGWAVGKIVEIYGWESTGKTGLALDAIKSIQDKGGIAALIDAEHALNTEYCDEIGVDVDQLYLSQPSFGEQAIQTIRALIATGEIDLIVVDSVAAMIPLAELEGESGEIKMALHARMMSQGMKLIHAAASDNNCTVIFLNQLRKTMAMHGPDETTTGGKALRFYSSQRVEVKRKKQIKEGDDVIGFKQQIKCVKNKVAPPFQFIENDIVYGKGIDKISSLVDACVAKGVFEKKGAYFYYDGTTLAQGVKKLRTVLEDNPELVEELIQALEN